MTVQYSDNYLKILVKWTGSAWKAVWKELLLWLALYYAVKMLLRYGIPRSMESDARETVAIFYKYTDKVPLQFLLGFFVGQVLNRWWQQVEHLPWPDDVMTWVAACLPDDDPDSNLRRHTVARYLVLSQTLVLRSVSTRIRKRFPNEHLLVSAGLMTEDELKMYQRCPCPNTRWQLPLQWALTGVLVPLNVRGQDPVTLAAMGHLVNTFNSFRTGLRQLFMYNWISLPLVYTQTVSVVVYGYFALCLIGHQSFGEHEDIYVPVLTILQFIFYVGWFKVAQDLMLPFGEDDDDIELNWLLDRHISVAMTLANYVTITNPPLVKDGYFESMEKNGKEKETYHLPYTGLALKESRDRPPKLLAAVNVPLQEGHLKLSYKQSPYQKVDMRHETGGHVQELTHRSSIAAALRRMVQSACGHGTREPIYF